jgi:hypothetical protein
VYSFVLVSCCILWDRHYWDVGTTKLTNIPTSCLYLYVRVVVSLKGILYAIVNNQNLQIQQMYDYLDAKSFPEQDNCNVYVDTIPEDVFIQRQNNPSGATAVAVTTMTIVTTMVLSLFGMCTM